jgi:hypothetical protein
MIAAVLGRPRAQLLMSLLCHVLGIAWHCRYVEIFRWISISMLRVYAATPSSGGVAMMVTCMTPSSS